MNLPKASAIAAVAAIAIAAAGVLAVAGNRGDAEDPIQVQVFEGRTAGAALKSPQKAAELKVLVASMIAPRPTLDRYSGLVQLLGQQLGRPTTLLLRKGYAEGNSALQSGEADIAFVCTGAFLQARRLGHALHPLVVPIVSGKSTYHSQILVPVASPARSLLDLGGLRMAYVDPLSLTGYLWVQERLKASAEGPQRFFSATQFTGSHDRSVQAVAAGLADAAAVDSLIADAMFAKDPALAKRLRVLERSPEFGSPPVVARADMPAEERAVLTAALLNLHRASTGQALLKDLGIDHFAAVPADHFATVQALEAR